MYGYDSVIVMSLIVVNDKWMNGLSISDLSFRSWFVPLTEPSQRTFSTLTLEVFSVHVTTPHTSPGGCAASPTSTWLPSAVS